MKNIVSIKYEEKYIEYILYKTIGISNENKTNNLTIIIDKEEIVENVTPYLEVEFPDNSKEIIKMNRISATEADIEVKKSLLKQEGFLKLQFVLMSNNNTIFKSEIFELEVKESLNVAETIEEDYPNIIDRIDKLEKKVDDIQFDTFNYTNLQNKPQINQIELNGNKELSELGLKEMTNSEIEKLLEMED